MFQTLATDVNIALIKVFGKLPALQDLYIAAGSLLFMNQVPSDIIIPTIHGRGICSNPLSYWKSEVPMREIASGYKLST